MDDAHVGWREDETQDGYIQFREYDGDDEVNEAVALPVELYVFIREPLESRLEALTEAVRELLPSIEWEGESWGDPSCPECGGLMPLLHESDTPFQQRSITRFGVGHQEWCGLARLRELVHPQQEERT